MGLFEVDFFSIQLGMRTWGLSCFVHRERAFIWWEMIGVNGELHLTRLGVALKDNHCHERLIIRVS